MLILVLSENSSFKESQIVTITNIGPNHVIPCGNICPPIPLIIILFALRWYTYASGLGSSTVLVLGTCT